MTFSGFSRDTLYTPVPNPVFGHLLEEIDDLAELKVVLRGIWLCHRQRGSPRMTPLAEFVNDRALLRGLSGAGRDAVPEIRRGLRLAVERGVFLRYAPGLPDGGGEYYLLNTPHDRRALERLQGQEAPGPDTDVAFAPDMPHGPSPRPNIFVLYEETIGMLSPMLAEELKDAEENYPAAWVREAFAIAAGENKRSWRYVSGILRRWASEGRSAGRNDGKPGRHPAEDQRRKHLEAYQRRRAQDRATR